MIAVAEAVANIPSCAVGFSEVPLSIRILSFGPTIVVADILKACHDVFAVVVHLISTYGSPSLATCPKYSRHVHYLSRPCRGAPSDNSVLRRKASFKSLELTPYKLKVWTCKAGLESLNPQRHRKSGGIWCASMDVVDKDHLKVLKVQVIDLGSL